MSILNPFTPSVAGSVSSASNNYSEEEQVIGTWIDGKPIYRQVITGVIPLVGMESVIKTINLAKQMILIDGYIVKNDARGALRYSISMAISSYGMKVYVDEQSGNNPAISIVVGSTTYTDSFVGDPITLIVEYTKTTDD